MSAMRIFDTLFVNQLFSTSNRGETLYYPNGLAATGYRVPAEREPGLRVRLRWLVLFAVLGAPILIQIVDRLVTRIESSGFVLPPGWLFAGSLLALVIILVGIIIYCLSLFAKGLDTVPPRG